MGRTRGNVDAGSSLPKASKGGIVSKLKGALGSSSKDKGKAKVGEWSSPSPSRPPKRIRSGSLVIRDDPPPLEDPPMESPPREGEDITSHRPRPTPLEKPMKYPLKGSFDFHKNDHRDVISRWIDRPPIILPSLFPSLEALELQKIRSQVTSLLSKAGLSFLVEVEDPGCYSRLVKEFLASFEVRRSDKGNGRRVVSSWSFSLCAIRFAIPRKSLIEMFNFPRKAKNVVLSSHERDVFWSSLVEKNEYFVGNMSEQQIRGLVWKVIHRLVAENLDPRQETGRVTVDDLTYMFMISKGKAIDVLEVLSSSFEFFRDTRGIAAVGGGSFITFLAMKLNFQFFIYAKEVKTLDMKKMIQFKMLNRSKEIFISQGIASKALVAYNKRVSEEGNPSGFWIGASAEEGLGFELDFEEPRDDDVPMDADFEEPGSGEDRPHYSPQQFSSVPRRAPWMDAFSALSDKVDAMSIAQRGLIDDVTYMRQRQDEQFAWQSAFFSRFMEQHQAPPPSQPSQHFVPPSQPTSPVPQPFPFEAGPSTAGVGLEKSSTSTSGDDDPEIYSVAPARRGSEVEQEDD